MRGWLAVPTLLLTLAPSASADDLFESKIRPVLVESCFPCHGAKKVSGGLRVDSRQALLEGGDSGPAVVPKDPAASLLLKAMRHEKGVSAMPPKKPMDRARAEAFAAWIAAGARWPQTTTGFKAERHWAFSPLAAQTSTTPAGSPVDAFIDETLKRKGYTALGPADRRTLIRRATFDLTGLPPTAGEVEAFRADRSHDAFAKVVDRLLSSPRYGERWGRHWLDVVRYADSAGENSDHPLPHAWRYRNWVIDAFAKDKPYDEFIREQVAGDILAKQGPPEKAADRVVATGYLAIARRFGHEIDKDIHLTFEDTIDTLGKSVLGLTIGCARCHTHKYDPITADDYYALYGILSSTRFPFPGCEPAQQPRDLIPIASAEQERVVAPIRARIAALDARLKGLRAEREAKPAPGEVLVRGAFDDGKGDGFATPSVVAVKKGEALRLSVSPQRNHGADTTLVEFEVCEVGGENRKWDLTDDVLAGFMKGNPPPDKAGKPGVWCFLDGRTGMPLSELVPVVSGKPGLSAWRDGDTPSVILNANKQPVSAWTKLAPRSVFMHPAPDGPVSIAWLSPIDGKVRVAGRLADAHPGGPDGVAWQLEHQKGDLAAGLRRAGERVKLFRELTTERATLAARLPAPALAYAVTEGTAKDARLHQRGDPEKLGKVVPRRWLSLFGGTRVPAGAGSGRLQLAEWLTHSHNPLTARVMANRVWQHHFGKGLVKTPNDFGTRGSPPTHPELLDWLAVDFERSGWSVKHLHRRIMLSRAYQRSGIGSNERDPANDTYWRFDRRRLSAEEIRDALLVVGDTLDTSPAGPHPFPPQATWNFSQHAPFNTFYETNRRSVYLMVLRNRRHPFLGLFDGADPNASTPDRQVTTVPTQALYFMNDPFFHKQAAALADRLLARPEADRVDAAFRLSLQRAPTPRERAGASRFLTTYLAALTDVPTADRPRQAWAAYVRVLLAGNEFLYQD